MESLRGNVFLYFLRDPRDMAVRYIGITSRPKIRLAQHWSDRLCGYTYGCDKRSWMNQLEDLGLRPEMDLVLSGLTRIQAKRAEHFIVSRFMEQYPGQLLQAPIGLLDPMDSIRELWNKSHIKQRIAIKRFIESQQVQPC